MEELIVSKIKLINKNVYIAIRRNTMPTLDWIGKDKVINHHMDVPYRVLDEQYSYGAESENMIIHGDNLSALKSLLPQYEGQNKVHLY